MAESDRDTAATRGHRTYQGNPCYAGHDGTRYTLSGACVECVRTAKAAKREDLRKRLAAADAAKAGT